MFDFKPGDKVLLPTEISNTSAKQADGTWRFGINFHTYFPRHDVLIRVSTYQAMQDALTRIAADDDYDRRWARMVAREALGERK